MGIGKDVRGRWNSTYRKISQIAKVCASAYVTLHKVLENFQFRGHGGKLRTKGTRDMWLRTL